MKIIILLLLLLLTTSCVQEELTLEEECIQNNGIYHECGRNECQLNGGEICPMYCGPPECIYPN